jgi:hypothetical protein
MVARDMKKNSSTGIGWVEIVAGISALWLVAAMAIVGSRIQTQVEEQRAIELELADGSPARTTPGFFAVAGCMLRYGGWQLAQVGGAPALALLIIIASNVASRRRERRELFGVRRSGLFRDQPEQS